MSHWRARKQRPSFTMSESPFRFLDLPTELRCMIYDRIEITASRHVLTQSEAGIENWFPNPIDGDRGSSITFIRPRLPLAFLRACRLVKDEAGPILQHKLAKLETLPLRFLVDANAASALASGDTLLRDCFHTPELFTPLTGGDTSEASNIAKAFIHQGEALLRREKRLGKPVLEMTLLLDHATTNHGATTFRGLFDVLRVCCSEFFDGKLKYNAPVPDMLYNGRFFTCSTFAAGLVNPRSSAQINSGGLNKEEFERHLKDLDKY
ncbi:hypothetical protein BKA63DRAFT_312775 [Paraphoma chrysanthemicola]|nr:hypothetical protein BKA63DRAFT_312775 [Paraphoma chrysanthemicola]